ncbi:hypothetical protein IEQ34_005265 [Dendrobium chrysotoxum]|uniref:Uncharacterized protein n=1 Tax=Dendrobium chrysotoxum TaxID=161865 RepID=A0AAV7H826_DENCH|nr:hypothetical protein IEQ34_005265 [Dendrobium chrysotoxum]
MPRRLAVLNYVLRNGILIVPRTCSTTLNHQNSKEYKHKEIHGCKVRNMIAWSEKTLPPIGQLPFLKSLTHSNMLKVKWLENKFNGNDKYRAFPLLEVLHIKGLEVLKDWFEAKAATKDGFFF